MDKKMIKELLEKVTEMMKPHPVYAVGGCVRDYILGVEPKDYDFCTPALPEEIEALIRKDKRRAYLTGKRFGTLGCKVDGHLIEITTFRTETYAKGNRKPEVEYVNNINEDLSRRDFTINAIALRLTKGYLRFIDPFNGTEDIESGIIRCVGSPKQRLKEDPLRMLRAIRFACRFGWMIHTDTYKKIGSGAIQILSISKERWMSELDKILMSDNVREGLMHLWITKLFNYMIPELSLQYHYKQDSKYHCNNLDFHTMRVVEACPKDINLRWAGLLHDIAKPFVRTEKPIIAPSVTVCGDENFSMTSKEIDEVKLNHVALTGIKANYVGHEVLGAEMVLRIAKHLNWSNERTEAVHKLVKHHLEDSCPLREFDNEGKK